MGALLGAGLGAKNPHIAAVFVINYSLLTIPWLLAQQLLVYLFPEKLFSGVWILIENE
jgi:hypothetical protein